MTEGLDSLREQLEVQRASGARFAKWRAVILIGEGIPTAYCIEANAHALARGALPGAGARTDRRARGADGRRQRHRDDATGRRSGPCTRPSTRLYHQRVDLQGILLKPNMVAISGRAARHRRAPRRWPSGRFAASARPCRRRVPGIVFLSGGQSDEQASENLNAINSLGPQPWVLSFSYGRALQAPGAEGVGRISGQRRRPGSPSWRFRRAATAPPWRAATPRPWRARQVELRRTAHFGRSSRSRVLSVTALAQFGSGVGLTCGHGVPLRFGVFVGFLSGAAFVLC